MALIQAVPEPAAMTLGAFALLAVAGWRRSGRNPS
jgi:hypothetical protein